MATASTEISIHAPVQPPPPPPPPDIVIPKFDLPETDDYPLDTPWHRDAMNLLIEVVKCHLEPRTDFFVGGNMFIYYGARQSRTWEYRGPDFFFVKDVDGTRERRTWVVYEEEGRYPDVIIELLSESTAQVDRTVKKKIYEQTFRTPEYYLYDPDTRQIEGWRHDGRRYQPITPDESGRMWSEQFELWLGIWEGKFQGTQGIWLRFFDTQGRLVWLFSEREHERAEQERQRAEQERQRADAAEAEAVRLRQLLVEKGISPSSGKSGG